MKEVNDTMCMTNLAHGCIALNSYRFQGIVGTSTQMFRILTILVVVSPCRFPSTSDEPSTVLSAVYVFNSYSLQSNSTRKAISDAISLRRTHTAAEKLISCTIYTTSKLMDWISNSGSLKAGPLLLAVLSCEKSELGWNP